jgi:hypothetical protein
MYVECKICKRNVVDSPNNILIHIKGTRHVRQMVKHGVIIDELLEHYYRRFGTVRRDKRQRI